MKKSLTLPFYKAVTEKAYANHEMMELSCYCDSNVQSFPLHDVVPVQKGYTKLGCLTSFFPETLTKPYIILQSKW